MYLPFVRPAAMTGPGASGKRNMANSPLSGELSKKVKHSLGNETRPLLAQSISIRDRLRSSPESKYCNAADLYAVI